MLYILDKIDKTMSVSTIALSNNILKYAFEHDITITPMKLQRLMYLIYAAFLQETGILLFQEPFQCWKYGAVLQSVYDKFSCFKAKNIETYATDANGFAHLVNLTNNWDLNRVFNTIMARFSHMSATDLCNLTRAPETAWSKAFRNSQETLDIQDILADPCVK